MCPCKASLVALPFKDNALCIETQEELQVLIRKRIYSCLFVLPLQVLTDSQAQHHFLFDPASPPTVCLPNLIDSRLLLGHQGHAKALDQFQGLLNVVGVLNMAGERVPCYRDLNLPATVIENYFDVRHVDGHSLTDGVGDGQRLLQVLDNVLESISKIPTGRVFIHCQQGRSRSAAVVAAWLMKEHEDWSLFDAIRFIGERRPEIEINCEYLEALEAWAIGQLGRANSLEQVYECLPRHVRMAGTLSLCA